jgi:hypothetical protein
MQGNCLVSFGLSGCVKATLTQSGGAPTGISKEDNK